MAPSLCDVALRGVWNASTEGHHYVDLDMTLQIKSGPDGVLPVLKLEPEMEVEILSQGVYRLKNEPSHEPDYSLGFCARVEGPDGQTYYGGATAEPDDDVSITSEATSRKMITRDMRISPSPVKRLFPPSPDTRGGYDVGDNSDDGFEYDGDDDSSGSSTEVKGFSNDTNDIFDVSSLDDCEKQMQSSPRKGHSITFTKGLQPRHALPEFDLNAQQDMRDSDADAEDKENEVPKGEVEYEGVCSRAPLVEIVPKRDSTAVLISALNSSKEEPDTNRPGNITPQSRVPKNHLVVSKRTSRSPQKVPPSKIPIKRMHKDESSGSDQGPFNVVCPENNVDPAQFMHKRNSPIARMAIMAHALSSSKPLDTEVDYEAKDGKVDATRLGEPSCCWPDMGALEMETPTRLRFSRKFPGQGVGALDDNEGFTWPAEKQESGVIQSFTDNDLSGSLVPFGQENLNEGSSNDPCLESSSDEIYHTIEEPESENFDIDEFYGDDEEFAGSSLNEDDEYEEDNTIDLPSPSTASQRSLKWHCSRELTELNSLREHPILEAADGMLRVRTSSKAVPANIGLIATLRVTLTGTLKEESEEFKATLPEDDGHMSIQWELRFKPPQVNGWALELFAMLPLNASDQEYDSYVAEWQPLEVRGGLEENQALEADHVSEMETAQDATDSGNCPCCSYHIGHLPLVNTDKLMAVAGRFSHKLSIRSQVARALLHDLSKPCGKAVHVFGAMLRNSCGEEGLVWFIVKCIKFSILLLVLSFSTRVGYRAAEWSVTSWEENYAGIRPNIIDPMLGKIRPAVCGGMEGAAGGRTGQSVDIAGKEVAGEEWPSTAPWAVLPSDSGEGINDGRTNSTENGSLTVTADTASIRAPPEVQPAAGDGDGLASKSNARANAADEGTNIGSGNADKANDARKASLRDRVDWILGWRGPLFD
ncbi:hypothetical protein MGYG_06836 [Nannizzia gypsea CBS 118893]|uniref:Uncharacterized protein n=1 Tax=Arthroderma gypseum (strain ATCC MYA-4604 / CBS 118893) TaxID=535722 RepID=E4V1C2_ARTGP|nr:hypothetical protein MGYG_06836 [Nannizzia gypsea CBS 118893]EFR03837.1 hypothetical protein MGYG_06836 [Nannizzia gypsea CBS 118893]